MISPEDATGKEAVETALRRVKKTELQSFTDVWSYAKRSIEKDAWWNNEVKKAIDNKNI